MVNNNLYKAISDFQKEVPVLTKDTEGYGYQYTDLPKIFTEINPILKKHGLGFTQLVTSHRDNEGRPYPILQTQLFHVESGEFIVSDTPIPENVTLKGMNQFQVLGSAITYLRRYALSSILGLVTDTDNDAQGEEKTPTQSEADDIL